MLTYLLSPLQEDEALDVLRVLSAALCGAPALTALNLSDNALGEKGVRACEAVLTGKVGGHMGRARERDIRRDGSPLHLCAVGAKGLHACVAVLAGKVWNVGGALSEPVVCLGSHGLGVSALYGPQAGPPAGCVDGQAGNRFPEPHRPPTRTEPEQTAPHTESVRHPGVPAAAESHHTLPRNMPHLPTLPYPGPPAPCASCCRPPWRRCRCRTWACRCTPAAQWRSCWLRPARCAACSCSTT